MITGNLEEIKYQIKRIPLLSGCYLWLGYTNIKSESNLNNNLAKKGRVLYVGKAIQLRSRILQYLSIQKSTDRNDIKTNFLLTHVNAIDWIITHNETEALLLENNLIKEHDPPYNVRLKDNKRYPFIGLTMGEMYPRLFLTRKKKKKTDQYFGPYPNVRAARSAIHFIQKIFPIRKRALKLPLKKPGKPCINFHMKRCWAPCTGEVAREEYADMVYQIKDFLEGKTNKIKKYLTKKMKMYALEMRYENAARMRNIIHDLEIITTKQAIHSSNEYESLDILAVYNIQRGALIKELKIDAIHLSPIEYLNNFLGEVVILKIRYGKLISKQNFFTTELKGNLIEKSENIFLTSFLRDYYLNSTDYPPSIYLSHNIDDLKNWENLLRKRKGESVKLIPPSKNQKMNYKNLISMAITNAKSLLKERSISDYLYNQKIGLKQIQKLLKLKKIPESIECYDISNLQGKEAVGAGIFFKNGLPYKKNYRKYRIKLKNEPNDPAMIYEVLNRRLARIAKNEVLPPDLILVDGGITQLNAALKARVNYNLNIPIASLAKKKEEIYLPGGSILKIDRNSLGMLILRAARDEAHRFAIFYHRRLRAKKYNN